MGYNSSQTKVRGKSKGGIFQRWRSFFAQLSGAALHQPRFPIQQVAFSYISSFIGIAALAYLSVNTEYPLIAAPFGATAVLAYGVPSSPLAQPRNIIGGNFMGAISGIVAFQLFGDAPWVMALAVATAIKLMQLTKTVHPPGGAVALVSVMSHATWTFLGTPILVGSIIIVLWTYAFCKIVPGRPYPRHWF
jgi:CBS-domain-containing membrane protein